MEDAPTYSSEVEMDSGLLRRIVTIESVDSGSALDLESWEYVDLVDVRREVGRAVRWGVEGRVEGCRETGPVEV